MQLRLRDQIKMQLLRKGKQISSKKVIHIKKKSNDKYFFLGIKVLFIEC